MTDHSAVIIRPMELKDIGNSLLLSKAEGWNQTESDWKRLAGVRQNICLVAESGNRIIGTATAMNYSNDVAWIGMVLVDKEYRGKGISKMILSRLLQQLDSCRSVKLDATPAGQPVYEKFGFIDEYTIFRMTVQSISEFRSETVDTTEPVQPKYIPEIIALDHIIFGAERSLLINSLVDQNPGRSWLVKQNGRITGFVLGRQGSRYYQVGPVFAHTVSDARMLIGKVLSGLNNQPVVADVHSDKEMLVNWLNSIGFSSQRHFVRMYLRENPLPGKPGNQYLICGPEFG